MKRDLYVLSTGQREAEIFNQRATLDDLKAALAEHGMVAVPVEPDLYVLKDMAIAIARPDITRGTINCAINAYEVMIKAAEGE